MTSYEQPVEADVRVEECESSQPIESRIDGNANRPLLHSRRHTHLRVLDELYDMIESIDNLYRDNSIYRTSKMEDALNTLYDAKDIIMYHEKRIGKSDTIDNYKRTVRHYMDHLISNVLDKTHLIETKQSDVYSISGKLINCVVLEVNDVKFNYANVDKNFQIIDTWFNMRS